MHCVLQKQLKRPWHLWDGFYCRHARLLLGRCISFPLLPSPRASVCFWADAASFPLLPSPCASVFGQMQHHFRFCRHRARVLLGRCSIISVIGQMQHHFRFCRHHARLFLGRWSIIPLPLGHLTQCPTVFLWILPFFSLKDSKKEKKKCIKAKIQSDGEKKLALLLFIKQCLLKVHPMGGSSETYLRFWSLERADIGGARVGDFITQALHAW